MCSWSELAPTPSQTVATKTPIFGIEGLFSSAGRASIAPAGRLIGLRSKSSSRPPTICTAQRRTPRGTDRNEESAGVSLRHNQPYLAIPTGSLRQDFVRHHFDNLPVLSEELCGVVNVRRLHFNGASSPSAPVRYLKMECVVCRLRAYMNRLMIVAHSVSPLYCVALGHTKFANWLFVRPDCGGQTLRVGRWARTRLAPPVRS